MDRKGTSMLYLRGRITRSGKTQAQIASEVGVAPATLSQYVSGLKLPSAAKLPALASALGCTVDELFREPANKKSSPKQDLTGKSLQAAGR